VHRVLPPLDRSGLDQEAVHTMLHELDDTAKSRANDRCSGGERLEDNQGTSFETVRRCDQGVIAREEVHGLATGHGIEECYAIVSADQGFEKPPIAQAALSLDYAIDVDMDVVAGQRAKRPDRCVKPFGGIQSAKEGESERPVAGRRGGCRPLRGAR